MRREGEGGEAPPPARSPLLAAAAAAQVPAAARAGGGKGVLSPAGRFRVPFAPSPCSPPRSARGFYLRAREASVPARSLLTGPGLGPAAAPRPPAPGALGPGSPRVASP